MESIKGRCRAAHAQDDGRRAWLRAGMSAGAVALVGGTALNGAVTFLG